MFKLKLFLLNLGLFNHLIAIVPVVDFDQSMHCIKFPAALDYRFFKTIYQQNHWEHKNKTLVSKPESLLIPKIIHFIWLGSPLPDKYQKFIASWRAYHPNWEIKIWQDQDLIEFNLKNKWLFEQAANYGYKSDLARYEILDRFGGVYVDIDFECLNSFDFLHEKYSFYAGLFPYQGIIANGLIASCPGHPIMQSCIDNLKSLPKKNGNIESDVSIQQVSGPIHFTKCVLHYLNLNRQDQNIIILPASYLFAFPVSIKADYWAGKIDLKALLNYRRPESLAVHYWGCSWVK